MNKPIKALVTEVYDKLGVQVSEDDPLVLLLHYQREQHDKAVESFKQEQQQYLLQITKLIQAKRNKSINWTLCLGIINSLGIVLAIVLLLFK